MRRTYIKQFQKETLQMIVCKLSPKILIAFEKEVIVLNADTEQYTLNQNFNLKPKSAISDVKLSFDEKMLAIALARNEE